MLKYFIKIFVWLFPVATHVKTQMDCSIQNDQKSLIWIPALLESQKCIPGAHFFSYLNCGFTHFSHPWMSQAVTVTHGNSECTLSPKFDYFVRPPRPKLGIGASELMKRGPINVFCVFNYVASSPTVPPPSPSVHLGIRMSLLAKKSRDFKTKKWPPKFHLKFRNPGPPTSPYLGKIPKK